MAEVNAVLYRWMGQRMVTSHYAGHPIVENVTVEKRLVLRASAPEQLAMMVAIAAVDGWRVSNEP